MADDCYCCGQDDPCHESNCTFFDGDFTGTFNNFITSRLNGTTAPTTFTGGAGPSISKGNPPGCLTVTSTLEATAGQSGDRVSFSFPASFDWNPAAQGAISAIKVCYDTFIEKDSYFKEADSTKPTDVSYWAVISQNGRKYGKLLGGSNTEGNWIRQFQDGLVSADFMEFYEGERPAGATGIVDFSSHPDLSISGGPVNFGIGIQPKGASSPTLDTDSETTVQIDNVCYKITSETKVGTPCTGWNMCDLQALSPGDFSTNVQVDVPAPSNAFYTTPGPVVLTGSSASTIGNLAPSLKFSSSGGIPGFPAQAGISGEKVNKSYLAYFHGTEIDPGDFCGIRQVTACFDYLAKNITHGGVSTTGDGLLLACQQNGKTYLSANSLRPVYGTPGSWNGTTDAEFAVGFQEITSSGFLVNSHPDFETAGNKLKFGIARMAASNWITADVYVDNLCVKFSQYGPCERSYLVTPPSHPIIAKGVACTQAVIDRANEIFSIPIVITPYRGDIFYCSYYNHNEIFDGVSINGGIITFNNNGFMWIRYGLTMGGGVSVSFDLRVDLPLAWPECGVTKAATPSGITSGSSTCFSWQYAPNDVWTIEGI